MGKERTFFGSILGRSRIFFSFFFRIESNREIILEIEFFSMEELEEFEIGGREGNESVSGLSSGPKQFHSISIFPSNSFVDRGRLE